MKNRMRLTESDLNRIVNESVKRVLNEVADDINSLRQLKSKAHNQYMNGLGLRDIELSRAQQRIKDKIGDDAWTERRNKLEDDIYSKYKRIQPEYLQSIYQELMSTGMFSKYTLFYSEVNNLISFVDCRRSGNGSLDFLKKYAKNKGLTVEKAATGAKTGWGEYTVYIIRCDTSGMFY